MVKQCIIYFYESFDDFYHHKNLKSTCIPFTAFKHNKDTLRLYRWDRCVFDSNTPFVYITRITFDF